MSRPSPDVRVAAHVVAPDGQVLTSALADVPMPTASVAKVLLLAEVAQRVITGSLDLAEPLTRADEDLVADSGIWHRLGVDTLPLGDVAALVGAVSDNLATNVLLRRVGLDAVHSLARDRLALVHTGLHDRVREVRGPEHAPTLSTGTASEWCSIVARLTAGTLVDPAADALVREWLAANTDLSLVADPVVQAGLADPLAHPHGLFNKTGTDAGTRADVGAVGAADSGGWVCWAAIAGWTPGDTDAAESALAATAVSRLRAIGQLVVSASQRR